MNSRGAGSAIKHSDFLIVGGGLAGVTAAETLRAEAPDSSITILSAEALPPYHQPPLSKGYLLGDVDEARLFIRPASFYRDRKIELLLDTPVYSITPASKIVSTSTGRFGYGQLLIATGCAPQPFLKPGAELPGVFKLRYKSDADAIRAAAREARRALIAGGSYLGMEIAMTLRKLGLDVTVVERGSRLFPYLCAQALSDYFEHYAKDNGVRVLLNNGIIALHGVGKVEEAELNSGGRLPCNFVVTAIGTSASSDFLAGSGIALEDGYVVVDDRLRTSAPDIYAAGDVTTFYDPIFGRRRQIRHWDNAVKQGKLAAYNMVGSRLRYDELSYFFCDVGAISFAVLGDPEEGEEWIGRGSLDERSYGLFYLKSNLIRALFTTGRPAAETRAAEGLIRYRVDVGPIKERLSDPSFALEAVPVQTALILQGGGALGAFECGVVKALEEEQLFPDVVAGVSIGAFNGAIIAANPRNATKALEAFWNDIAIARPSFGPLLAPFPSVEKAAIALNVLTFGVPHFFKPRWLPPFDVFTLLPMNWTSFYVPTPIKALISKYVDFTALKKSPVRLFISAVNVRTAEFEVFDSYVDDLTPDHLLASGSLPPGFPWTEIGGKAYWDGGIVSNSPLDLLRDRWGTGAKRVFVVDLYLRERALPSNLMEVMARREEIAYSEKIKSNVHYLEMAEGYRALVDDVMGRLRPDEAQRVRQRPEYIQLMAGNIAPSIVRIVRPAHQDEPPSRDFDFSDIAIQSHKREGYCTAKQTIAKQIKARI